MHDISDLSDHCAIAFSINAQIREKEEIKLDSSDKGKDEFKLIRSDNTDEILNQLVSKKELSESYVDLNTELEKDTVRTLETLRTLERKWQDFKEASMRTVKFNSDQNKPSFQEKENSMPKYNNEYKEAKKLMKKARKPFFYALKLFDELLTPISEYGIELCSFKGLEKLEKTNLHFYKFISGVKQSTADNSVYDPAKLGGKSKISVKINRITTM